MAYKDLIKVGYSKVLGDIHSSKIWNQIHRRLQRQIRRHFQGQTGRPEWLEVINKVQAARQENATLEIEGQCILIPAFRFDGVGIQAMLRICVMLLARQSNVTYVHLPFMKLAHQNLDPIGHALTPEEWAVKWEAFFNFGKDEFHIADLANVMGEANLAKHLSVRRHQFGTPQDDRDMLLNFIEKIRGHDSGVSGIYTFDLKICRQSRKYRLFLDAEFIQLLQEKFETNGYKPEEILFKEQYLNIAIHIRRGDVWGACQAGSKERKYARRLVSEAYYVELIQRLWNFFESSSKPVRFHIFSDGQPDDFGQFAFIDEREAALKLESGILIENIQFHLCQNSIDAMYHMIKAPIFVPGKSTFSVVAVLLSNSYIFYENEICEFYQYNLLEKYMEKNPRFISLNELEERIDNVIEVLSSSRIMT